MKSIYINPLKILATVIPVLLFSSPLMAADAAAGKSVYDGKGACASCHGVSGAGDGVAAVAFNPKPASFATASFRLDTDGNGQMGSDTDIANVIINGGGKYGGNAGMAGRPDLTADEVSNLIAYIRTLKK